jgi:hypothetical protein
MKSSGSHVPSEYQLPSEVLAALQRRRVQPGVSLLKPTVEMIMNKPLSPAKPTSNSHLNLLKLTGIGLSNRKDYSRPSGLQADIPYIQRAYSPRTDKHRSTKSTSDLRFLVARRLSLGNDSLGISSEINVKPAKQTATKEQSSQVRVRITFVAEIPDTRSTTAYRTAIQHPPHDYTRV